MPAEQPIRRLSSISLGSLGSWLFLGYGVQFEKSISTILASFSSICLCFPSFRSIQFIRPAVVPPSKRFLDLSRLCCPLALPPMILLVRMLYPIIDLEFQLDRSFLLSFSLALFVWRGRGKSLTGTSVYAIADCAHLISSIRSSSLYPFIIWERRQIFLILTYWRW